jgi:hypothetical protein
MSISVSYYPLPTAPIQYKSFFASGLVCLSGEAITYPAFAVRMVQYLNNIPRAHKAIEQIQHKHGLGGFYRGFTRSLLTAPVGNLLYYEGMNASISVFGDNYAGHAAQGFIAQAYGSLIWAPASRIIQQKQSIHVRDSFHRLPVTKQIVKIVQQDSLIGLYRGYLPQYIHCSLTGAAAFSLRKYLYHYVPPTSIIKDSFITFVCFFTAGCLLDPLELTIKYPAQKLQLPTKALWRGSIMHGMHLGSRMGIILPLLATLDKKHSTSPEI